MHQLTTDDRSLVSQAIAHLQQHTADQDDWDLAEGIQIVIGLLSRFASIGIGPDMLATASGVPLRIVRALAAGNPPKSLARIEVDALIEAALPYTAKLLVPTVDTRSQKLTVAEVARIKRDLATGASLRQVARTYRVGETTIMNIRNGTNWKHVLPDGTLHARQEGKPLLADDQVIAIRRSREAGTSYNDLAMTYGVSPTTIKQICDFRVYKHILPDGTILPRSTGHQSYTFTDEAPAADPDDVQRGRKLTAAQVVQMRQEWDAGAPGSTLARRYGVNRSTVESVCTFQTWKHVLPDGTVTEPDTSEPHPWIAAEAERQEAMTARLGPRPLRPELEPDPPPPPRPSVLPFRMRLREKRRREQRLAWLSSRAERTVS